MSCSNSEIKKVLTVLLEEEDFEFSEDPDTEEQEIESLMSMLSKKNKRYD